MIKADKTYDNFIFKDAHALYIQSIEGYMELLKITKDDANFQVWVKQKLHYTMDRAEKCKTYLSTQMSHKHQAGYFTGNVNKEAFNYLRDVLANPDKPEPQTPKELI
jgi:hypothetical protein